MRRLILSAVRRPPAVAVEQHIEALDHVALGRIAQQFEIDRGESAVEIVDACECLFGHPDDAEATIIRHDIARARRIDKLRRERDSDDHKLAFAAIQQGRKARARHKRMRVGEVLVDDDLRGCPGLGHSADPQIEPVERGLADVGQRNELTACGLAKVRNIEQRQLGDAGIDRGNTGNLGDLADQRLRRPPHHGKNVGECIAFVIGRPGLVERPVRPHGQHERRDAAGDHQ